ncbi:putative molybdenum carrier protein [Immundisolibacter cernigliae]|uniref:putative molybdenum carrier protein n=1 Tax=Immundisolibacter cernigliae TaxID=1810504 RepID=UPI001F450B30|nr:putative molybdenum carrier protein [Immundisolibacter cernigliae]
MISGGQTGVDRAALDVALELGLPCGGWCPAGRRAEDGPIDARYPLAQTDTIDYAERTRRNVAEADATLVLCHGGLGGGTLLTVEAACALDKPCLVIDLRRPWQPLEVQRWLQACAVTSVNLAGPRETGAPGIHALASDFLRAVLAPLVTDKTF